MQWLSVKRLRVVVALTVVLIGTGAAWYWWTHAHAFSEADLLRADARDLPRTTVTAVLDVPMETGKNLLWCGTFQLAWNEACGLLREDIRLTDEPPMVASLNRKGFTRGDLDTASFVALAAFGKDDPRAQIEQQLRQTFRGQAAPQHLPQGPFGDDDLVAYAYLFKAFAFETPFEIIAQPLNFGGTEVASFGVDETEGVKRINMLAQVRVHDYVEDAYPPDFVIELLTDGADDRLILAMTEPKATLAETVAAVMARANNPSPRRLLPILKLQVPMLNVDITRTYDELIGKRLIQTKPASTDLVTIMAAMQNIRFQLDNRGVRLRSEAELEALAAAGMYLIFDRPFLILLVRKNAKTPYFALWVDNPELLVKAK